MKLSHHNRLHPKLLKLLTALGLLLSGLPFAASGADSPAGTWTAEFDTQIGTQKYVYEFKVDGTKLTGTAQGTVGDDKHDPVKIRDGKFADGVLSFVEIFLFNDMEIEITYKGTLKGDEIAFERQVATFANEEFKAKRAPKIATSIAGEWEAEFDTAIGPLKYRYSFVVKDGKLAGKAIGTFGGADHESKLTEGKLTETTVSFVEMLDDALRIEYTGKIESKDVIKFTRKVGELAVEELTAKRMKTPVEPPKNAP